MPPGVVARIGSKLPWLHDDTVCFAAFLPDGKSVFSATYDHVFHLWEYPSGQEVRRFGPGPTEPTVRGRQVALSPRR